MADLNELNGRFAIPGVVKFEPGEGNLPRAAVTSPHADAHVYLHGAHVTHFQPRGAEPVLFMSGRSYFSPDKPIRGGVPIIFPWFGPHARNASAPPHGFARTLAWDVREVRQTGEGVSLSFALTASDATRRWLANDFELIYTVTVGPNLGLSLAVHNRSPDPLNFEEALHTYLHVGGVERVGIEGLAGREYLDKTAAMQRKTQPPGAIRIEQETDRVYLDTPDTVTVTDPPLGRRITVAKRNSATTVVWNPWIAKAKAMPDVGDDEWPQMLCIETANAADNALSLPGGQTHIMDATIGLAPSALGDSA